MALKALLESLDGLSEEVKKQYKQTDGGKFVLDVEGIGGLELADTSGLRSSLEKERDAHRKFEKEAKELKSKFDGLNPDEAREALKKVEEFSNIDPSDEAAKKVEELKSKIEKEFSAKEKQLLENHKKEKTELTSKTENLFSQLRDAKIKSEAVKAITAADGSVDLLLPHVTSKARLAEDNDGKYRVEIIGDGEVARLSKKDPNKPMGFGELVEEMKNSDAYMPAFNGSNHKGAGLPGSPGTHRADGNTISLTKEQARDVRTYRNAAEQAKEQGKELVIKE